jgi:ubiquinone biosynthesis protein UbiJ
LIHNLNTLSCRAEVYRFVKWDDWQQESANTLKLNITEFLQDESKDLPPAPEINIFSQQVDQLKEDFDRLEARVTRLNDTLKAKQA